MKVIRSLGRTVIDDNLLELDPVYSMRVSASPINQVSNIVEWEVTNQVSGLLITFGELIHEGDR